MRLLIATTIFMCSALSQAALAQETRLPSLSSYFATYTHTQKICDNEGCVPFKNYATIIPHQGGALVNVKLAFDFGHTCEIENSFASFNNGKLIVEQENSNGDLEQVEISLNGNELSFHQDQKSQLSLFCGARGSFSAAHPLLRSKAAP